MKKALIIIILLLSLSGFCQWDSVKFQGDSFDSIALAGNTIWVKQPTGCTGVTIGGECYDTVRIGSQTWLAENLQFDDGSSGIYYPDSSIVNLTGYGRLYDYYAAIRIDADIEGWHLPTLSEYQTLLNEVGFYNEFDEGWDSAGVYLKEAGTAHWNAPNYANNSSGFSAVGAGGYVGSYFNFRSFCYLMCSTEFDETQIYIIVLFNEYDQAELSRDLKTAAFSVRLIKD